MNVCYQILTAEALKIKRTLALWLAILIPLVVGVLQLSIVLFRGQTFLNNIEEPMVWFGRQTIFFWSLLVLPLFVTLETALLAGMEHTSKGFKHIFALPIPRFAVYASKQTAALALILLSFCSLIGWILLSEILLAFIKPDLDFTFSLPVGLLLKFIGIAFAGSLMIVALHSWVALWWRSFVAAAAFGITMTIAGVIVINTDLGSFYPWTIPALSLNNFQQGQPFVSGLALSGTGFLFIFIIGGLLFIHRDVDA